MEKHIGAVVVRFEESDHYVVKVRIVGFEGRTEANLKVSKDEVKAMGLIGFKTVQKSLPFMKGFILGEINKQYPSFWVEE